MQAGTESLPPADPTPHRDGTPSQGRDQSIRLAARGLKPVSELAAARPHGDRLRYMAGCRCDECRKANSRYESERQKARRNGDWNGVVGTEKARRHIEWLASKGLGRRAIAAAADVGENLIVELRAGRKTGLRARSEKAILAVTPAMASDRALVPAGPTWVLVNELLADGVTKTAIARRLGSKAKVPALQIGTKEVTVRTAYLVERAHAQLAACDARRTWRLIRELLSEGYTQRQITQALETLATEVGEEAPILKPGAKRIPARAAALVERVHSRLTS